MRWSPDPTTHRRDIRDDGQRRKQQQNYRGKGGTGKQLLPFSSSSCNLGLEDQTDKSKSWSREATSLPDRFGIHFAQVGRLGEEEDELQKNSNYQCRLG